MRKIVYLIGLVCLTISISWADGGLPTSSAPKTSNTSAKSGSFTIGADEPLTKQLLDYAWINRENQVNQRVIADYLLTKPTVSSDYETAWKTARLVSFIGNYGIGERAFVTTSEGVMLFNYGVSAGKIAISAKPSGVEGQYWYAMDLGSYGLAKGILSAASNAKEGMNALRKVASIDPSYQWYGSSRILGRYYQELPGIFGGSDKKALELLTAATTSAPQFRNNWVFLGQYYISSGNYESALNVCQKALTLTNQDGKFEEIRYTREAQECVVKANAKLN